MASRRLNRRIIGRAAMKVDAEQAHADVLMIGDKIVPPRNATTSAWPGRGRGLSRSGGCWSQWCVRPRAPPVLGQLVTATASSFAAAAVVATAAVAAALVATALAAALLLALAAAAAVVATARRFATAARGSATGGLSGARGGRGRTRREAERTHPPRDRRTVKRGHLRNQRTKKSA